jgi:multidrug efflux pump subunit AcrB
MENQQKKTGNETWRQIGKWIYRLRSVILAIPIAVGAIVLALYNNANLPETVGINIQASGEYAETVSRSVAVLGPLAVTAVCLLMVFCSRKVLYPWLISLFSLVLPLLIYITNIFPG